VPRIAPQGLTSKVGEVGLKQPDGSIRGRFNPAISTSLSLLSLALNYRFLPIYER
jgi:hypothetical protein